MKSIQQITQELSQKRNDQRTKKQTVTDQQSFFNGIADLIHNMGDYIVEELKHDNKVEVTNHPSPLKEIKISNFRGIFGLLESISKTIKGFKLPDIFKVQGEVTVKNQISIPDVKFPEPLKTVGVNSLPEYVKENLEKLVKKDFNINVEAPNVNIPETKIEIDLSILEELVRTNNELLKALDKPQVEIDLSGVVRSNDQVREAIQALRFPIPNFSSSWQKSLDMQSKDLPTTYAYKTVATKKVIDYIQIIANDGNTYRRTFVYDTDGTTDVVSKTGWIKQ